MQSGWFYKRQRDNYTQTPAPFSYLPRSSNQTYPRFRTRVRFPAELMTWRNVGQVHRVKDVDGEGRSPVTVAGIATLFFCCSITATVALGVFCRKRNTVFPLEVKSDVEEDEEVDDCASETAEPASKNFDHRQTPLDSTQLNIRATSSSPPGSLQLSPAAHTPDIGTPADENHAHFRFVPTDNPHPVASAHAHNYVNRSSRETGVQSENFPEERSDFEHAIQIESNEESCSSQMYCSTAATASPSSSSSSPSSSSFFSLLSGFHKPQLMRSLGHVLSDVINLRWIRRQRVPTANDDQSAASDAARDDVDLTSLLPTL